jgi:hypothetical protein
MQRDNIAPRQFMSLDEWTMINAVTSRYWNWMITFFRTRPGIIVIWRGLNYPLIAEQRISPITSQCSGTILRRGSSCPWMSGR